MRRARRTRRSSRTGAPSRSARSSASWRSRIGRVSSCRRAGRRRRVTARPTWRQASADLVVVLGGDGTMLVPSELPRLGRARDRGQLGRVGFLSSMQPDEMETGLTRAFRGDLDVELPTSRSPTARLAMSPSTTWSSPRRSSAGWSSWSGRSAARTSAASPATGSSARRRRGRRPTTSRTAGPCSCGASTPWRRPSWRRTRSTRGRCRAGDVVVLNRTPDVAAVVLGRHRVGEAGPGGLVTVRLGAAHTLLATLPEATFVSRYRQSFST